MTDRLAGWSAQERRRLRRYASGPVTSVLRVHARLALAYDDGRGVLLSADEVAALIDGDDAVATAQANLALYDDGEMP